MSIGAETLAYIAIGTAIAGGAVSIMAQGQQAGAARRTAEYQAAVARNNAIIAERAAVQKEQEGRIAEQKKRQQAQQLIGRQRSVLAGNGVLLDTGSALDITADTAASGELDALNTRYSFENQAYNLRVQGQNFTNDAALADYRAATSDATLGAIGTIFSTVGSVADKWYKFDQTRNPTRSPTPSPYMAGYSGAG